ncbi:hypothetical protein L9F63_016766, partial [Diploptera punctata]
MKMEFLTLVLATALLLLTYYFPHLLDALRYVRKASQLPTRKPHLIFGHTLYLLVPQNRLLGRLTELIENNPPLFTIWMGPFPILAVTHPRHVEAFLGNGKIINKSYLYKFLRNWIGTGLLTSSGYKWHHHRKMLTPSFHFKMLDNFMDIFVNKSKIFVNILKKHVGEESFDVYPCVTRCALDIICETAMGTQGNLQEQGYSEYAMAVLETTNEIMKRVMSPWLYPSFIYNLSSCRRRINKHIKTMDNFVYEVIGERKRMNDLKRFEKQLQEDVTNIGRKKKLTFLDMLLECSENDNLTDEDIREEVNTFMFAGHDTVTSAISWTIQMLASHPEVQQTAYEEMELIFDKSDRPPSKKDLQDMKYLDMVVKETLRMYPSVPVITRGLKHDVTL